MGEVVPLIANDWVAARWIKPVTSVEPLQADEQPYVSVLPPTGASIQIAFYSTPAAQLAELHPVVAALLTAQPHARNGCYTLPMAALVQAAKQPPHQVFDTVLLAYCGFNAQGIFPDQSQRAEHLPLTRGVGHAVSTRLQCCCLALFANSSRKGVLSNSGWLNCSSWRLQILAQLQAIAAQNELRFEVNRSTALVFQVRRSRFASPQMRQSR